MLKISYLLKGVLTLIIFFGKSLILIDNLLFLGFLLALKDNIYLPLAILVVEVLFLLLSLGFFLIVVGVIKNLIIPDSSDIREKQLKIKETKKVFYQDTQEKDFFFNFSKGRN